MLEPLGKGSLQQAFEELTHGSIDGGLDVDDRCAVDGLDRAETELSPATAAMVTALP